MFRYVFHVNLLPFLLKKQSSYIRNHLYSLAICVLVYIKYFIMNLFRFRYKNKGYKKRDTKFMYLKKMLFY